MSPVITQEQPPSLFDTMLDVLRAAFPTLRWRSPHTGLIDGSTRDTETTEGAQCVSLQCASPDHWIVHCGMELGDPAGFVRKVHEHSVVDTVREYVTRRRELYELADDQTTAGLFRKRFTGFDDVIAGAPIEQASERSKAIVEQLDRELLEERASLLP